MSMGLSGIQWKSNNMLWFTGHTQTKGWY